MAKIGLKGKPKRIRGVYGGTLSRRVSIELDKDMLETIGEEMVKHIQKEARKDYKNLGRTPRGEPMGLPNTDDFFESFQWKVLGDRTVIVTSTWPWIERHVEGRDPYPMPWLTREKGMEYVPLRQPDGSVVVVRAPATREEAWIHPGVEKLNFLERGVRKGRREAMRKIAARAARQAIRKTFS